MPRAPPKPKNWPENIKFLTKPVYGKSVQPSQLQVADRETSLPVCQTPESSPVQIQAISDNSHPACGQSGLFAAYNLKPDTFICFYLGFVHGPEETDAESNYDLSLDRETQVGVDAASMGNEARFINDYRGIQSGPNAEFRDCLAQTSGTSERRIGVFVLSAGKKGGKRAKGIAKGEEVVVSYGKGFWSHRESEEAS
jgi:hypothetical protein